MICDIEIGSVKVSSNNVHCNETLQSSATMIFVIGDSITNDIEIDCSQITVAFQGITMSTPAAVTISASSVTLTGAGTNTIRSTSAMKAGIECSLNSNRMVQTIGESSLFVTSGSTSAGMGTGGNGTCGCVTILNGSVDSRGGTGIGIGIGIGTGEGEHGRHSKL
jgi:hypothetical protein